MTLKKHLVVKLAPVIVLILTLIAGYTQYTARNQAVEHAYVTANGIAGKESTAIQTTLAEALGRTEALAAMNRLVFESGEASRERISAIVRASLEAAPNLAGMASIWPDIDGKNAAFIGTEHGNKAGMLGAYWSRNSQNKLQYAQLQDFIKEPYFTDPVRMRASVLTEPYVDNTSGQDVLMVTIASPILVQGRAVGVATSDISLHSLSTLVERIKPYGSGYAYVVSDKGVILAHPHADFVGKQVTALPSVHKETIMQDLQSKAAFVHEGVSQDTGERVITSLNSFTLIAGQSPWFFGVVLPRDAVLAEANRQFYLTLGICAVGIILALGVILMVAGAITRPVQNLVVTANEIAKGNYSDKGPVVSFCRELDD